MCGGRDGVHVSCLINFTPCLSPPGAVAGVGPISINYLNATQAAVTQAQSLGLKATLVDMQACDKGGGGCQGCATHPGIDGHRRMYEMSYPVMKTALGW